MSREIVSSSNIYIIYVQIDLCIVIYVEKDNLNYIIFLEKYRLYQIYSIQIKKNSSCLIVKLCSDEYQYIFLNIINNNILYYYIYKTNADLHLAIEDKKEEDNQNNYIFYLLIISSTILTTADDIMIILVTKLALGNFYLVAIGILIFIAMLYNLYEAYISYQSEKETEKSLFKKLNSFWVKESIILLYFILLVVLLINSPAIAFFNYKYVSFVFSISCAILYFIYFIAAYNDKKTFKNIMFTFLIDTIGFTISICLILQHLSLILSIPIALTVITIGSILAYIENNYFQNAEDKDNDNFYRLAVHFLYNVFEGILSTVAIWMSIDTLKYETLLINLISIPTFLQASVVLITAAYLISLCSSIFNRWENSKSNDSSCACQLT